MANEILVHEVSNKKDFVIATEINGKSTNLTVTLDMNGNKGLISVSTKLSNDQIIGISAEDQGTIAQIGLIMQQAIKEGKAWQKAWHKSNSNGQLDLFDKKEGEDNDDESEGKIVNMEAGTNESDSSFDVLGGKASSPKKGKTK